MLFSFRVEQGSFIGTHDIRSMYLHVQLHPSAKEYFGFSVPNANGVTEYYYYDVIPFGYSRATIIMASLLRPIQIFLHALGVDVTWYVDDGGNIAFTLRRCTCYQNFTLFALSLGGWEIALNKTQLPAQRVLYLGFIIDSISMRIFSPDKKLARLQLDIDHIIAANRMAVRIPVLQTASALGMLSHLLFSHGEVLKICTREAQHELGLRVIAKGWKTDMGISDRIVQELRLCKEFLISHNGRPIRYEVKETEILKPFHKKYLLSDWNPSDNDKELLTMVSDASSHTAYLYQANDFKIVEEFPFNLRESAASSTLRELSAIFKLLTKDESFLKQNQGKLILWMTDSQSLCHIMRRGSRIKELQAMVLEIFELQLKWGRFRP